MEKGNIALGADHAGYQMKSHFLTYLQQLGYHVLDFGCFSEDSVDYPDFVHPVARSVEEGKAVLGLLFCGSGNGVAITANKHSGIRAALCWSEELSALARKHNDANILCLPARFISLTEAEKMVSTFLSTDFEGGRHQKRVDKISIF